MTTSELAILLDPTAARALTDQIKTGVEVVWELIKRAYTERAWSALGYNSWDDYCNREFGTARLRLPREDRAEVVASLRESGLSTRAISAATGINRETIRQEIASGGKKLSPAEPVVTGLDGKTYRRELPIHPLCEMFPGVSDIELQAMADSIARIGLIHPLTTFIADDGVEYLLDGKLRRAACRIAGVEPTFKRYEGDDPHSFVISMNVKRQHFTEGQRAFIALDLLPLRESEDRIDENESASLRDRWEFGRVMLAKRDGCGGLPNGYLTQLVERTGKSRSELRYREQFAAAYPTEDELANAISQFGSWDRVVENLKVHRRRSASGWETSA